MDEEDEAAKLVQAVQTVKSWVSVEKARITGSALSWSEDEPVQDDDTSVPTTES